MFLWARAVAQHSILQMLLITIRRVLGEAGIAANELLWKGEIVRNEDH